MQVAILGILIIGLGIQALYLRFESKQPNFKSFNEDYQKRLAYMPMGLLITIFVIGLLVTGYGFNKKYNIFNSNSYVQENNSSSKNENAKLDINDIEAVQNYIQGKWSYEKHTGSVNETWQYRFEITGNKIKIWTSLSNVADPFKMNEPPDVHEFSLDIVRRDIDGYQSRNLLFDESNVSLTYRALSPIWFVADNHWEKPVMRSGSGFPSWNKGW